MLTFVILFGIFATGIFRKTKKTIRFNSLYFYLLVTSFLVICNFNTMSFLGKIGRRFQSLLLNKYSIVFMVFAVFVTFFDEHNLINRWKTSQKISQLEEELKYYQNEIKSTKQKTNELQSSKENLEKFAREQYYMKKENEDIFIIKE